MEMGLSTKLLLKSNDSLMNTIDTLKSSRSSKDNYSLSTNYDRSTTFVSLMLDLVSVASY